MNSSRAFRHVNDSIRKLAPDEPATQAWQFVCECQDVTCHALVSLTLLEFDECREASPPVPILAAHEDEAHRRH
jgi:hypothetical protein